MTSFVYELTHPTTGTRFYVGLTDNLTSREEAHVSGRVPTTAGVISNLRAEGLRPEFRVLCSCESRDVAHEIERSLIAAGRRAKVPLANNSFGFIPSPSAPKQGLHWTQEERSQALRMADAGMRASAIASEMGRETGSIAALLRKARSVAPPD